MLKEFKAFVNQGNAMDLAVGVIIGAAFGKIVNSLVNDIIMPVIGLLTGGIDFKDKYVFLKVLTPLDNPNVMPTLDEARKHGTVLAYGAFINTVVEFFVIAFAIFLVVRQINKWRGPAPAAK
jgi:large conductance mechanosensitive channel